MPFRTYRENGDVVTIGSCELDSQQNSVPVANHMALATELRAIGGVRAGMLPPKTARTEELSNIALDQSIRESRESQSSNAKWIKSQMPASCQSRKRLQQVIPEPQPNS